jgi:flavin-dependent dehydrogenase
MPGEQPYDVIIVGAGPAGLSAAAHAQAHKWQYVVLEKGTIANTIDYY